MGCPTSCWMTAKFKSVLTNATCRDQDSKSPMFQQYLTGLESQRRSYVKKKDWYALFGRWIERLNSIGCMGHLLMSSDTGGVSMGDLCGDTTFKLKPLKFLCPVSCGCPRANESHGQPDLCPRACSLSAISQAIR